MKNTTKIIAAAALFAAGIFNTETLPAEAPFTTGELVVFTAKEDSTYKNITFQAYGAGATSGTVTLIGKNYSKFTDSTKIVAGYNADRMNFAIDSNDGKGTVNLNGTNTFSGNLEIKADTITSSGSSAVVYLSGVNAKFGAKVNGKIEVYISDTTSIGKLGGGQVVLNGDTHLLNGTTLTAGTNVDANLKSIRDGNVTLEGGAKLNSMNALNLQTATLTLTGNDTEFSTNAYAGVNIDATSTLTIKDGAKLKPSSNITNNGTMNLKGGKIADGVKIDGSGTVNWDLTSYNASVLDYTKLPGCKLCITPGLLQPADTTYSIATNASQSAGRNFFVICGTTENKVVVNGEFGICGGKIYSLAASGDGQLKLSIKPAEIKVTVSDAGYATVYSDVNLEIPDGVEVYAYTAKQDTTLVPGNAILKGTILPGGQGYVVKADKGKYIFKATKDKAAAITSILKGTIRRTAPEKGTYILSNGPKGVGFYPYEPATSSEKLSAGKAYYRMDN